MPMKIMNLEDLSQIKSKAQQSMRARQDTGTEILVGMGTCGDAAGAGETFKEIETELKKYGINAAVSTVGCIGMCAQEPLVDVIQGGVRVTYGKITKEKVARLISEHLLNGNVINEWVIGKIPQSGN
jgi:NADP-reducing hydrogenase subunit HndB